MPLLTTQARPIDSQRDLLAKLLQLANSWDTDGLLTTTTPAASVLRPLTDRSGSLSGHSSPQAVAIANPDRQYFFFQNISDETLWIDFGTTATEDSPSIRIAAGGSFVMEGSFVSTDSISVIGATSSKKYVAKEG
jgi:hypothetical protein